MRRWPWTPRAASVPGCLRSGLLPGLAGGARPRRQSDARGTTASAAAPAAGRRQADAASCRSAAPTTSSRSQPRPPVARPAPPSRGVASRSRPAAGPQPTDASSPNDATAQPRCNRTRRPPPSHRPPTAVPRDAAGAADALRETREPAALQQMQEQTAQLHRQFLDGRRRPSAPSTCWSSSSSGCCRPRWAWRRRSAPCPSPLPPAAAARPRPLPSLPVAASRSPLPRPPHAGAAAGPTGRSQPSDSRESRVLAGGDRGEDGLSGGDAGTGHGAGRRPGHRLHQARRDPVGVAGTAARGAAGQARAPRHPAHPPPDRRLPRAEAIASPAPPPPGRTPLALASRHAARSRRAGVETGRRRACWR